MEMYKKRNTDTVTIILAVGIIVCFLATIGYNTYISLTKEKIEVKTLNSNFNTTQQNN
ncbi:MAG: hypothetical protein HFJ20_08110 [Clostridia bacterium]|nr:hypothetical protein [Clostridia bacterium]